MLTSFILNFIKNTTNVFIMSIVLFLYISKFSSTKNQTLQLLFLFYYIIQKFRHIPKIQLEKFRV